ncbi:hypothetical protein [Halodurantibacterium flavum]|uniref:DUF3329 domain-containing protein n=1 Tax=Halodurantibacterium flavum TaxID=1382802 RepID=A0ABW4S3X8_9RHOB
MKLLDPHHPFFRAPWRRWATVLLPLAWAAVEFRNGAMLWGAAFAAAGTYAFWMLIVTRRED